MLGITILSWESTHGLGFRAFYVRNTLLIWERTPPEKYT